MPMRGRDHLVRGRDGAQRVRHCGDGDELGRGAQQPLVFVEDHLAAVVHGRDAQTGARLGDELLPGHDVRVVLELGDDDLVALADVLAAPALGDEVDAFGGAADEDDLVAPTPRSGSGGPSRGRPRRRRWRAPRACAPRGGCWSSRARRSSSAGRSPPAASGWWRRCPARPARLPCTCSPRMGKSRRMAYGSNGRGSWRTASGSGAGL